MTDRSDKIAWLDAVLEKHRKWVRGEEGGEMANLLGADLQGADLQGVDLHDVHLYGANLHGADLRGANLQGAGLQCADLHGARLQGANLQDADLREVNLQDADLRDANLQGAGLDYSCLPLWCGSLSANFDDNQLKQLAYHLVKAGLQSKNASEETKIELSKLTDFANGFHRAEECGFIEKFILTNGGE